MQTFEIDGKEYELKVSYKGIEYLNGKFEGGQHEVIGRVLQSDLSAFPHIVHASLLHAGENIPFTKVKKRVEELINDGELSLDDIFKISDEVVLNSFFYKATVEKMMKKEKRMKEALELLRD